ncbi:hypothetical protein [Thalassiella azotivora]
MEHFKADDNGAVVDLVIGLCELLFVALVGAARALWRYPFTVSTLLLVAAVHSLGGPLWVLASLSVAGTMGLGVWFVRPSWWAAGVEEAWRYRRRRAVARSWEGWCDRLGLAVTDVHKGTGVRTSWTPGLSRLRWAGGEARTSAAGVLTGRVRLLAGQCVDDVVSRADKLAAAAGARSCRVSGLGTSAVSVTWLFGDPLAATVRPLPVVEPVDVGALPVGVREDGGLWRLRLAGTHVLVVGVTGAGKGSVIWSMLAALGPALRDGWVQVWAVDGKGGMELAPGRALFARFAATAEDGVELLEDAAAVMTQRAARLAQAHERVHTPTVVEPLLVVLVDEVALLTAYLPDRRVKDRAEKALAMIATQGRAPGVVLVAALQDPRKEVLGLRNLFPTKVGMRLDEKAQVDMVLGDGARDAGALCHQIPESTPGVAFVRVDGVREPVRVRAAYLSDADIAALAATYPARRDDSHSETTKAAEGLAGEPVGTASERTG